MAQSAREAAECASVTHLLGLWGADRNAATGGPVLFRAPWNVPHECSARVMRGANPVGGVAPCD